MQNVFYFPKIDDKTLDLGCGIGFWSSLFVREFGVNNLTSADLTDNAVRLCKIRVPTTIIKRENAESLSFNNNEFSHVNCQGVIHHTPNTQSCLDEIYRVLNEDGTASVSVYYKNALLRIAKKAIPLVKLLSKVFLHNTGRGRDFSEIKNFDDLVRFYDGNENPIGKAYSKREFEQMLKKAGFRHIEFKLFFFPFRFFKFEYPNFIKGLLVRFFPFMIVANLKK
jgi:ubiquinone/menaquinone biosynthesis C-methylase UbiE